LVIRKAYKYNIWFKYVTMVEEKSDLDFRTKMFRDDKDQMELDEELAFFIHRFNSDIDTIECMPAFEDHLKELFPERKRDNP